MLTRFHTCAVTSPSELKWSASEISEPKSHRFKISISTKTTRQKGREAREKGAEKLERRGREGEQRSGQRLGGYRGVPVRGARKP